MESYSEYYHILHSLNYTFIEESKDENSTNLRLTPYNAKLSLFFSHTKLVRCTIYITDEIPNFIIKKSLKSADGLIFISKNTCELDIDSTKSKSEVKEKFRKLMSRFQDFYENLKNTFKTYKENPQAWLAENCPGRLNRPKDFGNNSFHLTITQDNYNSITNSRPPENFIVFEMIIQKKNKNNMYPLKLIIKNSTKPDMFFVNNYELPSATYDTINELVFEIESKLSNGLLPSNLTTLTINSLTILKQ